MTAAIPCWLSALTLALTLLVLSAREGAALFLPDSNELRQLLSRYQDDQNSTDNTAGSRTRRAIQWTDRGELLQLHNKLRGGVYPTASNMEYMVRHASFLTCAYCSFSYHHPHRYAINTL
ncbi:cysteine-rich secretory protein LCCL domain-containing 2-like [Coregonus clupeaformis]|uniref:cysteine-rich secretory protein LCCL domain-containing 2-like n=1 Tax=Coregonus clupeaformis TaxID=59861 RepID=UPI001E1C2562|nr:cysteine-rich secretory protein LCCL domain-containing 2-like [Coregonus clupeaformis]